MLPHRGPMVRQELGWFKTGSGVHSGDENQKSQRREDVESVTQFNGEFHFDHPLFLIHLFPDQGKLAPYHLVDRGPNPNRVNSKYHYRWYRPFGDRIHANPCEHFSWSPVGCRWPWPAKQT
jgi:hypothetical protein